MAENIMIPETAVDPVCGKSFDPRKVKFASSDEKGVHYFCSTECQHQFDTADTNTKKGFWKRYTDRLKKVHCSQTPPECV